MLSSTISKSFLLLGFCLFIHGVQSGVKSPYRKTEDLNVSGERVPGDNSAEYRVQQKENMQVVQHTLSNLTTQFQQFKSNMELNIRQIQTSIEQNGAACRHDHHGGAPLGSDSRTWGPGNQPGSHGGPPPGSDSRTWGPGNQPGSQCGRPLNIPRSFMRPPRVRNPENYDFAVCNVRPATQFPSNVTGRILMMQKRDSPTVYISIRVSGFDVTSHIEPAGSLVEKDQKASDRLEDVSQARQDFSEQLSQLSKTGKTSDRLLDNGHLHGLRIHSVADISNGCDATGDDYNPYNARHGGPESKIRHVGDLGNIECDEEGVTNEIITDDKATLRGQYSIIGKPLVIHESADDYNTSPKLAPGDRIACCIIEKIPSNLFNEYQFAPSRPHGSSADFRHRPGSSDIPSGGLGGGSSHYPSQGHRGHGNQGTRNTGYGNRGSQGGPGGYGNIGSQGGPGGYGTIGSQGGSGYQGGSGSQGGYGNRGQGGQGGYGNRVQPGGGYGPRDHANVEDHGHDHGTGTSGIVGDEDRTTQRQEFSRGKNPYSGNV